MANPDFITDLIAEALTEVCDERLSDCYVACDAQPTADTGLSFSFTSLVAS